MTSIPALRRALCEQCKQPVDIQGYGVAQHVSGWAVNRRGGGTNAVALSERHARWLCRFCLDDRKHGIVFEQQELPFDV